MNFEKKYFFGFYGHFCAHDFSRILVFFKKTVKKINISKTRKGIKISSDKSLRIYGIYLVSKFGGHSLSRFRVMCIGKK